MLIKITQIQDSRCICETGPNSVEATMVKDLFNQLRKAYGRCISKMYQDVKGCPKQVGWVFESRAAIETWVEVFEYRRF